MPTQTETMEKIVALCRRRGFIFGSSEIYGGIGGFWDYGPLGCELKRNVKDVWWNDMVRNPPPGPNGVEYQMVGVDCSIIMNPKVWEASGHATGFADPMIDCRDCKARFRADKVYSLHTLANPEKALVNDTLELIKKHGNKISVGSIDISGGLCATVEAETLAEAMSRAEEAFRGRARATNNERFKKCRVHMFDVGPPNDPNAYIIEDKDGNGHWLWGWSFQNSNLQSEHRVPCPRCGSEGALTAPRAFNLMFRTTVGALDFEQELRNGIDALGIGALPPFGVVTNLQDLLARLKECQAYLRPETAQGIFANFKNVMDSTRVKIPFGIAQIGKAFRNEINPRNFTFRSREFEQMEIEFFCNPKESRMWYEFWRDVRKNWYTSLGIKSDKLRPREQGKEELAHYSAACTDIEYLFPFSDEPQELEGVAHRGDFDLKAHGKHARNNENAFEVIDESEPRSSDRADSQGEETPRGLKSAARFVPHVIEPSAGADRFTLAVICEAYSFDESRASPEFMKFHPRLAPIKAGVFPLVNKDGMPEIAEPIYREIKKHFPCQYDVKAAIGKRYARMDEAGTPFCFTIDGQSKEDGTVTVRNRDDATQIRIDKSRCLQYLRDQLHL